MSLKDLINRFGKSIRVEKNNINTAKKVSQNALTFFPESFSFD